VQQSLLCATLTNGCHQTKSVHEDEEVMRCFLLRASGWCLYESQVVDGGFCVDKVKCRGHATPSLQLDIFLTFGGK
jgi:hypothetical protein